MKRISAPVALPWQLADAGDDDGVVEIVFKDGMTEVAAPIAEFLTAAGIADRDHRRWAASLLLKGARQGSAR
jgi:hypothetical protein